MSLSLSTGGRWEERLKPKPGFVVHLPGDPASSGAAKEVVVSRLLSASVLLSGRVNLVCVNSIVSMQVTQ